MNAAENIARAQRVQALMRAEAHEEAASEARVLVATDPNPGSLHILAIAERAAGNLDAALGAVDGAIRIAPQSGALRVTRATLLDQLGRSNDALAEWRALARTGLQSPELSMSIGRALAYAGCEPEADAILASALKQWPVHVGLQTTLAHLRWLDGARPDFSATLEQALQDHPEANVLRAEGVRLLLQAGLNARAEQLARAGLGETADPALTQVLAAALAEQGRLDEALEAIDSSCAAGLGMDRAVLLLRQGRGGEALAELRALAPSTDNNQHRVAIEALALRMTGDPAYRVLYDYEHFVRTYDLAPGGDIAAFNIALAKSLRAIITDSVHPLDQTLTGGAQSTRDLRDIHDPVIQTFLKALDAPIRAYIDTLDPHHPFGARRRGSYRLSGAWSVRLRPGGYHVNHVHNLGWISSAYYVALPPSSEADRERRAGWLKFGEPPWPVPGCAAEKFIEPREGRLVLFPSYMLHGTAPFTQGEERLTAAFDVIPA